MKLFVWDFHGVLEKDNEKAVIDTSNHILEKNGYLERFSDSDIDKLYGKKWYQYFEYLLPQLSQNEWLKLQSDCLEYQSSGQSITKSIMKPNDYAIDVLKTIKESQHQQIIISNTGPEKILWFLECVDEKQYFNDDQIFGISNRNSANPKSDALKEYLNGKNVDKIICIGDSESDLILGKEFGATNYYYRHPGRKHNDTKNADFIINDLREVLKEL